MIIEKINIVREKIKKAAAKAGRNASDIILVCAVKEANLEDIKEAVKAGVTDIGENRVQDAFSRYKLLNENTGLRRHFIGHLQTNKVKKAVGLFDLIHSVDSLRLAEEIQMQAEKAGKMQSILIEANVSGEGAKYGVRENELEGLVKDIRGMKNVMLLGLMAMAPYSDNAEDSRIYFRKLRELKDGLSRYNCQNIEMKHLSMGMSGDFEVAIEEGADIVRIGSAIFK